jgi:putative selenium metabolism protein SsnA
MLIVNGTLITWENPNQMLEGQAVLIRDGKIEKIGPESVLRQKYPAEEVLNAGGQYIMPGNTCAHTHFYGAYARGMGIPGEPAKVFPEILANLWFPLDDSLSMEDVKYSAYVGLIDAIRHGTTTMLDHHASYSAIDGSLDAITDAVDESGLRVALCYEVSDRNGADKAKAAIEENVRFIERVKKEKPVDGRVAALFGLHASLTLSEETLDACRKAVPDGTGFHVHVAEHFSDEFDSVGKSGLRVVDRFEKHGLLGPNSVLAHGVHLDAKEVGILAETGTWLTHQPRSNMNNGVGIGEVESQMRAGVKVCLGNDGMGNAMWEEWKTAYFVHKLKYLDPRHMGGYDVVQMAVYNNQDLINTVFDGPPIGQIAEGAAADLIFVDYHPYTPLNTGNLPWQIIFGFHESMITTTIVAGKILMQDRKLLTLDEEEITKYAREKLVPEAWDRYQKKFA